MAKPAYFLLFTREVGDIARSEYRRRLQHLQTKQNLYRPELLR